MSTITRLMGSIFGVAEKDNSSNTPVVIRMNDKKSTLFDAIVFPYIDLSDPYKQTLFTKHTRDMRESFVRGYLSICPIRDIALLAELTLWGEAAEAYEWLNNLHCVDFRDMHPEIARQIPHRINMVFANGDYRYPWNDIHQPA